MAFGDLPRFAKVASYVGAISAAVVSTGAAWTMLDLPVPATRAYVNAKDAAERDIRDEIIAAVLDLARDYRERLRRSKAVLVDRLAAATDPQLKHDLQMLIEQAEQDIADADSRIAALEHLRGKASNDGNG